VRSANLKQCFAEFSQSVGATVAAHHNRPV
jgi:hypothetical protein